MSEKRRDNRNRILREGEYQRTDGRYRYRYIDEDGKEKNVYSCQVGPQRVGFQRAEGMVF